MTAKMRLGIGVLAAVLALVGLVPAWGGVRAAAEEYNISYQTRTTQQSLGISPDGSRVCAVWTQFDVPTPQVFFRMYDTNARSWSPPLSGPPFQVSAAGDANRPRCAIDAAGYAHVVWQQKQRVGDTATGQLDVAYRRLAAGADAGNGDAWGGIETIAANRSSADIEAVENAPGGKVWLVVRRFQDGGASELELRSWEPGSGWSGPRVRNTGGAADAPRLATDAQGFVHIVFRNGGGSGISYTYLGPDGAFGPQLSVPNGTNAGAADIAVDRGNGDVSIVYAKEFTKLYYAKKSYGSDFSLTQIDEGSGQVDEPGIAWSANGLLTVTYSNGRNAEVNRQTSSNGGASWSGREVFAAPDGGVAAPWLVADRAGGSFVAYNRRAEGEVYFATSGGAPAPAPSPAPSPTPPPSAPAPPDVPGLAPACFAETGFCVRGRFLAYWLANGGLAINGFPLSDEFPAYLENGQAYTVQYFERVRLEYHPENAAPNDVLLGQFGRRIRGGPDPAVPALEGAVYFAETGHNITRAEFAAFYAANGGLAPFGYPLTEEFTEQLEDGQEYRVQYFERARFEWHPENPAPFQVLLGQFGRRLLGEVGR